MTSRLFLALEIPKNIIKDLLQIRDNLYAGSSFIKWEKENKLHITIKFLGDVNNSLIDDVVNSIDIVTTSTKSFHINFDKFGFFFRENKPSILWAGYEQNSELEKLYKNFEENLINIGFDKDNRKFKPHLTLLRFKGRENINDFESFKNFNLNKLSFDAKNITLFKSTLKPTGSEYEEIKRYKLL